MNEKTAVLNIPVTAQDFAELLDANRENEDQFRRLTWACQLKVATDAAINEPSGELLDLLDGADFDHTDSLKDKLDLAYAGDYEALLFAATTLLGYFRANQMESQLDPDQRPTSGRKQAVGDNSDLIQLMLKDKQRRAARRKEIAAIGGAAKAATFRGYRELALKELATGKYKTKQACAVAVHKRINGAVDEKTICKYLTGSHIENPYKNG